MGTEFWSAIAGAIVGGLIAFGIQMIALYAAKRQRVDERQLVRKALANSLVFKMMRMHGNLSSIHRHIEDCFDEAVKQGFEGDPWQIVVALANPPEAVHFSSDEMGMLLSLGDHKVFNKVIQMDVIHNSLVEAVKLMNGLRTSLSGEFSAFEIEGNQISSALSQEQVQRLAPRMLELNMLIKQVRALSKKDFTECEDALFRLHELLLEKLNISFSLTKKTKTTPA